MARENKKPSLEENFERIETLLRTMESQDATLEDSFGCYQEGMQLLKQCNELIDAVEKKVLKLSEDGGTDEF